MSASDEPRECEDCLAIMALGTNIYARCVKHQKHSDEPREEYEGQYDGQWIRFHDRAWRSQRVKAPMGNVIAAVLAEVASPKIDGDACSHEEGLIANAAWYIRQVLELKAGGT